MKAGVFCEIIETRNKTERKLIDKVYSSPLHYPGGKRWLVRKLFEYIPTTHNIISPFFGGGTLELNLAAHGKKVQGYDNNPALVNFWKHWWTQAEQLEWETKDTLRECLDKQDILKGIKNTEKQTRYLPDFKTHDEFWFYRAMYFYLFNRLSIYGFTYSNSRIQPYRLDSERNELFYTGQKETRLVMPQRNRMKLGEYKFLNIDVKLQDFEKTLTEDTTSFAYCDPPYLGNEILYKSEGFKHKRLAKILKNRKNWITSYNDVPNIRELYDGFKTETVTMRSGFRRQGKRQLKTELLIFSDDVYETFQQQSQQLQMEIFNV